MRKYWQRAVQLAAGQGERAQAQAQAQEEHGRSWPCWLALAGKSGESGSWERASFVHSVIGRDRRGDQKGRTVAKRAAHANPAGGGEHSPVEACGTQIGFEKSRGCAGICRSWSRCICHNTRHGKEYKIHIQSTQTGTRLRRQAVCASAGTVPMAGGVLER